MYSKLYSALFLLFIALFHASASSAQCNPTTSLTAITGPQGTSAQLSWPAVTGAISYEVFIAPKPATLPPGAGTSVSTNSFNAGSLTQHTTYDVCIRTVCSSGVSTWYCDTFKTKPTLPCLPPTQVIASATGSHTASVTWVQASGANAIEYKEFLWGNQPNQNTNGTQTSATSLNLTLLGAPIIYDVCLRSRCSFATMIWSNWVCDSVKMPVAASIENVKDAELMIYPNPTTDKFYIEAGNHSISDISLTDMYGKVLLITSLQANDRKEIDLTPYARGLYILSYETAAGTISRKIQKL